jgi:hypothetical protein
MFKKIHLNLSFFFFLDKTFKFKLITKEGEHGKEKKREGYVLCSIGRVWICCRKNSNTVTRCFDSKPSNLILTDEIKFIRKIQFLI